MEEICFKVLLTRIFEYLKIHGGPENQDWKTFVDRKVFQQYQTESNH